MTNSTFFKSRSNISEMLVLFVSSSSKLVVEGYYDKVRVKHSNYLPTLVVSI
jgi:hypothetical protein